MYTQESSPGKFEGNASQLLAETVYQASLDGCHEEAGSVIEGGLWAGLVLGKRYGFLVTEDSQGFVQVETYSSHQAAQAEFEQLAASIA